MPTTPASSMTTTSVAVSGSSRSERSGRSIVVDGMPQQPRLNMTVYQHVLPGMQADAAATFSDAVFGE